MDQTNINVLVQSIERSLHLIYKNLFSIKQYQFPPKVGPNLFKESPLTSPLRVRQRLRLRARQGVEGVPLSVRPTRAKLDYGHGKITYQIFSSAAAGAMSTVPVFFLAGRRKNGSR